MRVLLIPEIYDRSGHIEGSSTVMDLANSAKAWLELDPNIHIYWMLPRKADIPYENGTFHLDHERVTAFQRRRFNQGTEFERIDEYREEQIRDLADEKEDYMGYFDVVVNQHSESEMTLSKHLHIIFEDRYASVPSFQLVKHLIDFNASPKPHVDRYRNELSTWGDLNAALIADRVWSKAKWDTDLMVDTARKKLDYSVVQELDEKSRNVSSPMDFSQYDGEYSDEPQFLHLGGNSNISKKNRDVAIEVGEVLYQLFDIETVITSQSTVESDFKEKEFTRVWEDCSFDKYLEVLSMGDICICPTRFETGGKHWFEQLASGQVFIAWDRPWLHEYFDSSYKLSSGDLDSLKKLAIWSVKNWDEAVKHSKQARDAVTDVKDHMSNGEMTLDDLYELQVTDQYELDWDDEVLTQTMDYLGTPATLPEIDDASARFTDTGDNISSLFGYTQIDMVHALRTLGYVDVGGRTPTFEAREEVSTYQ